MAQIFPKWINSLALYVVVGGTVSTGVTSGAVWYFFSPEFTDVGYQPEQPVPFSHKLHAGELRLDCRYCHAQVEVSRVASVPPTQVCMNCHDVVKRDSELLAPIRTSWNENRPMRWVRVHKVPEYAYFYHNVHVKAGIGCSSCHGDIRQMETVRQVEPLSMGWCLDCHRNPEPYLRPMDQLTNTSWLPPPDQAEMGARLREQRRIDPPQDCTACHM